MADPYASVAKHYDIMVDWPVRLARELPFFQQLFREHTVRHLLDVGCGTGHHSRLFAGLGLQVIGIDPSEAMLEQARVLTPGDNPQFILGGFAEIPMLPQTFDVITVLGNTLAYVANAGDLAHTLHQMRQVMNPGARLCIQVVNYDNLPAEESRWLPLVSRVVDGREYLFLREYRRLDDHVEFTLITLVKDGDWQRLLERSKHFAITGEALQRALQAADFRIVQFYGDFQGTLYDPATSPGLIAVADIG